MGEVVTYDFSSYESFSEKHQKKFMAEYTDMLNHYTIEQQIELTQHLIKQFSSINTGKGDGAQLLENEEVLKKRYGRLLLPYVQKMYLVKYVYLPLFILAFPPSQEILDEFPYINEFSTLETGIYISTLINSLTVSLDELYLKSEPDPSIAPKPAPEEKENAEQLEHAPEMTQARQVLAIYYMLKAECETELRLNYNLSDVAKFAHLLMGAKITTIQKSEIYKKLRCMPNYNKDQQLLKDLQYIRPFFEALHLEKALNLIDAEIKTTKKNLPYNKG
ncbi:MAG: hypothetical protein WCK02_01600 [Bacteroidota bacterium]